MCNKTFNGSTIEQLYRTLRGYELYTKLTSFRDRYVKGKFVFFMFVNMRVRGEGRGSSIKLGFDLTA